MIGEFLLTDNDPFLDDSQQQQQHWPSSQFLDGKTTIPLHTALHQDKNKHDNDTPTHLTSILLKERGPTTSNASTTSSTLMAWAMALAQHRIDRCQNCPQCHSHPETCQCNFVDLILCRPTGCSQQEQQQQQQQEPQSAEAETSELNRNTKDTPLHPLLLQHLFLQQSSTENSSMSLSNTQRRYALGRIRVHTVSTRSEFLQCILSLHHRPPTEQPRHGILVDQLESWMMAGTTTNSHHTIQTTGSTPNHSAYPSSSSSFVDSVMVLSQLVALLVDTAQWTAQVQQQSRRNNEKTCLDSASSPFVLAVSSTDSASDSIVLHRRLGMFFTRIVECPPRTTS